MAGLGMALLQSRLNGQFMAAQQQMRTWEISPASFWFRSNGTAIWQYRHLLMRIVRRDFLVHHQQTLLGPLWIIFQPLVMLLMYVVIFEKAVGLSTDGLPASLFYLSGIILWNLFAECFTGTSFTFLQNGTLFSKVSFPRMIIPLSVVVVNVIRFAIQFVILFVMMVYIGPTQLLTSPLLWFGSLIFSVVIIAGLGMGLGLVFSILTAKYRDLVNVIHLISRLLMFATPIIYPISALNPEFRFWVYLNPLSSLVELFRFGLLGEGTFTMVQLLYSIACALLLVVFGWMLFNKFGNKLQDVI